MLLHFFFIFAASLIFLEIFIRYGVRLGFIDTPNNRSNHSTSTPSSAGIPVFVAIFLSSVFFYSNIFQNYTHTVFGIFMLGVYDDLKDIRARHKIKR